MIGLWLVPLCMQCMSAVPVSSTPVPVILDTDIGDDIDDTWALAMIFGTKQIDLKLIVTGTDNAPRKAALTAKLLERMERTDVPIGIGIKTTDKLPNQEAWVGDFNIDQYKGKVYQDGVQTMISAIRESKTPVTLLCIGPLTNIQEALKRAPDIATKARIVSMAGSVEIGYGGKKGRDPEYNVFRDVAAAKAVFDAPWDITITPLDTCGTIILKGEPYAKVASAKTERAKAVIENYQQWINFKQYPAGQSSVLYDTVAVYLTYDTSLCEMKTIPLYVDDKGNTVPADPASGPKGRPVHCAMTWKDQAAYEDLLVNSLIR